MDARNEENANPRLSYLLNLCFVHMSRMTCQQSLRFLNNDLQRGEAQPLNLFWLPTEFMLYLVKEMNVI
jgi:hypothetical protein